MTENEMDVSINKIFNYYIEEKNSEVIIEWEKIKDEILIDPNTLNGKKLLDALSVSYLNVNSYQKALRYIIIRINYMNSDLGLADKNKNSSFNFNFYYNMLLEIYNRIDNKFMMYCILHKYVLDGGLEESKIIKYYKLKEWINYKIINPFNNFILPFLFVIIIVIKHLFCYAVLKSLSYLIFLFFFICWFLYSFFYAEKSTKIILFVFNYLTLFYIKFRLGITVSTLKIRSF